MVGNDPDSEDIEALRRAIVRLALEALEEQPNRALPLEIQPETLERLVERWRAELGVLKEGFNDRADRLAEQLRTEIRPLTNTIDDSGSKLRALERAFVQQSLQLKNIHQAVRALAKAAGLKLKGLEVEPDGWLRQFEPGEVPKEHGKHPARTQEQREEQGTVDLLGWIGTWIRRNWLWVMVIEIAAAFFVVTYVVGVWPFNTELAPQRDDDFGITIEKAPQEFGAEPKNALNERPANNSSGIGLPEETVPDATSAPRP